MKSTYFGLNCITFIWIYNYTERSIDSMFTYLNGKPFSLNSVTRKSCWHVWLVSVISIWSFSFPYWFLVFCLTKFEYRFSHRVDENSNFHQLFHWHLFNNLVFGLDPMMIRLFEVSFCPYFYSFFNYFEFSLNFCSRRWSTAILLTS